MQWSMIGEQERGLIELLKNKAPNIFGALLILSYSISN